MVKTLLFDKTKKQASLLAFLAFLILCIGIFAIVKFQSKYSDDDYKRFVDEKNNVDLTLSKEGFEHPEIVLKNDISFNFRIIKTDDINCNTIRNVQLEYNLYLTKKADQFVVRFPEKKVYELQCIESPEVKLKVVVR